MTNLDATLTFPNRSTADEFIKLYSRVYNNSHMIRGRTLKIWLVSASQREWIDAKLTFMAELDTLLKNDPLKLLGVANG